MGCLPSGKVLKRMRHREADTGSAAFPGCNFRAQRGTDDQAGILPQRLRPALNVGEPQNPIAAICPGFTLARMDIPSAEQREMEFDLSSTTNGYGAWQDQRQAALKRLAQQLGLPLGREVELRLHGGIVVQGKLRPREELLFFGEGPVGQIELAVGRMTFLPAEIEACVCLD
jgi:hypothetical protein